MAGPVELDHGTADSSGDVVIGAGPTAELLQIAHAYPGERPGHTLQTTNSFLSLAYALRFSRG